MPMSRVQSEVFTSVFTNLQKNGFLQEGMYELEVSDSKINLLSGCSVLTVAVLDDGKVQMTFNNGVSKFSGDPRAIRPSTIHIHLRSFRNSPSVRALTRAQA